MQKVTFTFFPNQFSDHCLMSFQLWVRVVYVHLKWLDNIWPYTYQTHFLKLIFPFKKDSNKGNLCLVSIYCDQCDQGFLCYSMICRKKYVFHTFMATFNLRVRRSQSVAVETRPQVTMSKTTQPHYNTKQTIYLSTMASTGSIKLSEKTWPTGVNSSTTSI